MPISSSRPWASHLDAVVQSTAARQEQANQQRREQDAAAWGQITQDAMKPMASNEQMGSAPILPPPDYAPDFTGVGGVMSPPASGPDPTGVGGGGGALSAGGGGFDPGGYQNSVGAENAARPNIPPPDPQLLGPQAGYDPRQAANTGGYDAQGYKASSIGVSPNATVSGRLTQLIDENSRYIQQARQRAMQQMNARGFLNSTMAGEAGVRAAIDAGLPIAQGDAAVYDRRELAQMDAINRSREFTAGAQNEAARWGSQLAAETERFNVGAQNEAARWQSQLDAESQRFNTETLNNMAMTQWSALNQNQQAEFMARLESRLGQDQALRLAQFNQQANRIANMDSVFGNLIGTQMQTLATVASNSKWSPEQQRAMTALVTQQMNYFMQFYNQINGLGIR